MEATLSAVRQRLRLLLAVSLVLVVVTVPRPSNRSLTAALEELTAFRTAFVRATAEDTLTKQAESLGATSLQKAAATFGAKRAPRLVVAANAPVVRPLTFVRVSTLAEAAARSVPGTTLTIGAPDVNALASSLSWRLARSERTGTVTIDAVELFPAQISKADIEREQEVARLRVASLEGRQAVEAAEKRVEVVEQRVEFQSKRRSKYLGKSLVARAEARTALTDKTKLHEDTQASYDREAQAALQKHAPITVESVPEFAMARVTIESDAGKDMLEMPVPLAQREVPVTPLAFGSFSATHAAGLWDEVQSQDADTAIAAVRSRFNWHMHGIKLGGLELLGAHLLQVLPCALPCLIWFLLVAIRRAATSYSPFSTEVPTTPPRVGFSSRFLELLTLVLLPLAAVVNAAAALVIVHSVPIFPAMAGLATLMLGGYAFGELRELREQIVGIVRSHSNLPPAPR